MTDRELLREALATADASLTEWSAASRAAALIARRRNRRATRAEPDARAGMPSREVRNLQRAAAFGSPSPAQRAYQIQRLGKLLPSASPARRRALLNEIADLRAEQLGTRMPMGAGPTTTRRVMAAGPTATRQVMTRR